jgi:predicted Ser/Thr protein kinase
VTIAPIPLPADLTARFEPLGILGKGGMSVVYRARQKGLERAIALKVLKPGHRNDADYRARFLDEGKLAAKIRHPNVVNVYEAGEAADGTLWIAYELVEGRPFNRVVERGPPEPRQAVRWMLAVLAGLQAIHDGGILHRDLKPENVLLGEDGRPRIVDFGIARTVDRPTKLTESGIVVGTAGYISPETLIGRPATAKSDVYSAGVLAFVLVTGRPPFEQSDPIKLMGMHIGAPPPDPRSLVAGLPDAAAEAILIALEKDPAERPDTAAELAEMLAEAYPGELGTERIPTKRSTRGSSGRRPRPRSRRVAAAIVASWGLLAGAGMLLWWTRPRPRPEPLTSPTAALTPAPAPAPVVPLEAARARTHALALEATAGTRTTSSTGAEVFELWSPHAQLANADPLITARALFAAGLLADGGAAAPAVALARIHRAAGEARLARDRMRAGLRDGVVMGAERERAVREAEELDAEVAGESGSAAAIAQLDAARFALTALEAELTRLGSSRASLEAATARATTALVSARVVPGRTSGWGSLERRGDLAHGVRELARHAGPADRARLDAWLAAQQRESAHDVDYWMLRAQAARAPATQDAALLRAAAVLLLAPAGRADRPRAACELMRLARAVLADVAGPENRKARWRRLGAIESTATHHTVTDIRIGILDIKVLTSIAELKSGLAPGHDPLVPLALRMLVVPRPAAAVPDVAGAALSGELAALRMDMLLIARPLPDGALSREVEALHAHHAALRGRRDLGDPERLAAKLFEPLFIALPETLLALNGRGVAH